MPAACRTWNRAPVNAAIAAWLIERAPRLPPKMRTHISPGVMLNRSRAAARSVAGGGTGRPVTR